MNLETAASARTGLHLVDLLLMGAYLVLLVFIGLAASRQARTTSEYFLGGQKIPSWALALSMVSAKISSVSFLALPAASFALDWRMFVPNMWIPLVAAFAVWILIPFFRRSTKTTAFEYLSARFGPGARLYGAVIFLIAQVLRLGSIMYLMTIPIQMFTGIPMLWVMIITGGFCAVYTIVGGLEAVVWTDVLQTIVLYIGGLAALCVMLWGIPGGITEVIRVANENQKFSLGSFEWNAGERTFWTMAIVGITTWVTMYTSDQILIQRFLAARDLREARQAGWLSAFLCLPTWAFFFFLGTSLFVFYRFVKDPVVAGLPADSVFPHFILTQMPPGLTGLVIAGIVSAGMGSLSASLNAFATVATVDILKPYVFRGRADRFYTLLARLLTGLAAILMLGLALVFATIKKESFLDLFQQITGIIGGVLPCFFLLGFFIPRVNRRVLWQAFSVGLVLNIYLALVATGWMPPLFGIHIHSYWISSVVIIVMLILAPLLAWLQRTRPVDVAGLTVFTTNDSEKA